MINLGQPWGHRVQARVLALVKGRSVHHVSWPDGLKGPWAVAKAAGWPPWPPWVSCPVGCGQLQGRGRQSRPGRRRLADSHKLVETSGHKVTLSHGAGPNCATASGLECYSRDFRFFSHESGRAERLFWGGPAARAWRSFPSSSPGHPGTCGRDKAGPQKLIPPIAFNRRTPFSGHH